MSQGIADKIAKNNDEGHVVTTGGDDDGLAQASEIRTKEASRAHGGFQKY